MRIRQIDLVGFKSFREPTKVTLLPGLNAVVGPNGCGKSNISDAIRWVMGEQSVKNLRAKDMEDVIFGGNATSDPLNMAEVTLTFDQADEASLGTEGLEDGLAAQIAKLAEFSVTRKIFRSGESQYLINGSVARLRDITELFMGSGVGPKAYAMIEQGRVGQIVQAKPEELRMFIEEAAGTTRFRARKIASERKLARTRENLSRVNDVMREIDRQLGALRRQAKRAEEYRLAQDELRTTEIGLASHRFQVLHAERDQIAEQLAEVRQSLAGLQEELTSQEAARDEAQAEDRIAKEEIEVGFSRVAQSSAVVVRARERQAATRDVVAGLDERIERTAEESRTIQGRDAELAEQVRNAEEVRVRAAGVVRRAEVALQEGEESLRVAQPEREGRRQEHADTLAQLNENRGKAAAASARRAEGGTRMEELRGDRTRLEERAGERRRDVENAGVELEEARGAQHAARELHDRLEGSRRRATAELRGREESVRSLEEQQAGLREGIVHVRGRVEGLQELEQAYAGYAEGIGTVMAMETPPRALLVEVLEIPENLEPAAAAALGEVLQGAVVGRPLDGAQIADHLRTSGDGRVSLVPIEGRIEADGSAPLPWGTVRLAPRIGAKPGYERLRDALFGNVILADDLATAVNAWNTHGNGYLWVTRAGDVVHPNGVVTGGQAPASADILERRRALSELGEKLATDERDLVVVETRLEAVRSECAQLGDELRRLDSDAHEATLALVASEHRRDAAEREQSASRARSTEAQQEFDVALEAIARAEVLAREAQEAEAEAVAAIAEWEERLESAVTSLAEQQRVVEECERHRDAFRRSLGESREAMTHAVSEHAQREHEHSVVMARVKTLVEDVDRLQSERASATAGLELLARELEEARVALAEREAGVEAVRTKARHVQDRLGECEQRLSVARRGYDSARDESSALETRSASLEAQVDALAVQTREHHGVEVNEAEHPAEFEEESALARIANLRDRLGRLGDVNLAAIADAKELEDRHAFLLTQRSDLESSMENLEQTIGELSRTTRKRFKETFEQANEKFREVFVELFKGGEASLELTNPSNMMETGVDLVVQPPGKRLGSLAVLSGGERALTAVSLIMALFSLRATPFCVLDEVDAPLDDANVTRYNAMLRRMSARTQFIVITHKQRTMESADALYGVTMAEAGVSQIVSVRMGSTDDESQVLAASA
ncbi:MAG: chromosome segregation protein SMC [Candidatus Binatia bacterium]|nr:chromosome segregation protein SMC [Candidatus Binatia bacterium]